MSGKAPFEDLSDLTALRRVMFGERPTAEEHPNLPANDPLWKLILRCWDSTPKSRPSIREVTGEVSLKRSSLHPTSRILNLLFGSCSYREKFNPKSRVNLSSAAGDCASQLTGV